MIAIIIFRKKIVVLAHRHLKCGPQYGKNGEKNYLFGFQKKSLRFLYECACVCVCWGLSSGLKGHEGTQIKMKKLF